MGAPPQSQGTAVILGGTGFIGRPVCRALAELGYDVVAVARRGLPVAGAGRVVALDLAAATVAEVTDVLAALDPTVIVNAAGGAWGLTDSDLHAANVGLVEHVLAAATALPRRVRLVQVGSVHEYGLVPIGESMSEESATAPVTLYGKLKAHCAEMVIEATRVGTVDGIVLRVGNVTGAGQPAGSLLGAVATQLHQAWIERRPAVLELGPLGSQRDFLNLTDAVAAVVAAATRPVLEQPLVNIGHGRATSARHLVEMLIATSGVPTELREKPAPGPETHWQQMRLDRARRVLGWAPSDDLGIGVRELWQHLTTEA